MVAAGGRHDTDGRDVASEQVGKRAAGFERSGVLQQFQLEGQWNGAKTEIAARDLEDGRHPDVPPDHIVGVLNVRPLKHAIDNAIRYMANCQTNE